MTAAAGKGAETRDALLRAFGKARAAGDVELMETAALRLPFAQTFGTHPGQIPALMLQAYTAAVAPASKSRLAAGIARAWAYGGDADRAAAFAVQAVDIADRCGEPELLAGALDAALLAHWGPDDFRERLQLAARLDHIAAQLTDPEARLSAHVWRLTTAWECLDIVAVQRQLRALDMLAQESGSHRIAFFAASRRAMHALVTAEITLADRFITRTRDLGARAAEPDLDAVMHSVIADRARQLGDLGTLRSQAAEFQDYGAAEGVQSVSAEAAVFWLSVGETERAGRLLDQLAGAGLDQIPRDVDFLLTVASLVEVACSVGRNDIAAAGTELLEPYAGRAVLNAGAVSFHGVVDHYIYLAQRALGRSDATRWRDAARNGYRRIGATWWANRLGDPTVPPTAGSVVAHLRPDASNCWTVGRDGATTALPDLKGLHYLRHLLKRPGVEVGALDLVAAIAGKGAIAAEQVPGDIADTRALAAYRQRQLDIDAELTEAESWADSARATRLRAERDALGHELAAALGLGGRRRTFGSNNERARVAVRKAIAASMKRIERHDPILARFLRETVHTGAACRYDPDPTRPVTWLIDAAPTGAPATARHPQ